ncbi:MAG: O-antigen ligase family protein [Chitinophagaceae bacterium]
MKRREIIILGLFLLFITSFFLSFAVALKVIVMGLLILFAFTDGTFKQKFSLFKEHKYAWFMLAFALALLTSFLLSANHADGRRFLQLRLPLLLFPLSIGLMQITKELRDRILLGSAIIVSLACFATLGWAVYRSIQENNSAWLYNDALSYLIGQQSIYTSLLVNISIYVFAYYLFYFRLPKKYKLLLCLGIVFLFIISYLLASRNLMLILYSTVIVFSFLFILKKKKYRQGVVLLFGILISVFLVFRFLPKTSNRFKELAYTQFDFQSQAKESHYGGDLTPDQWNGANFRLAAWQCGWQLFREHPLAGVGLGDKKDELFKIYEQKRFHFAIATKKNVHNNYLDILYSMGVAGLVLFLSGWILLPFIQFIKNRDGLAFIILLTFSLAMLTENYFDRSIGAMLFGFFITFLLAASRKKNNELPPV